LGKDCNRKWQHRDREIPNMIRLQQFSHLIGGAASHHEHGRDEEDAVQYQVLASFLERGDVVRVGGERQNTGKEQQRQSRKHSVIYVERGGAGFAVHK
jgi:hypothetical protein